MRTVIGCLLGSPERKMSAISRSFQTQRNWKIPNEAIAGTESGITIRRKTARFEAPSMRAASMRSFGSVMKKFRNRKIASGNPNAVCASQMPANAKAPTPKCGTLRCQTRNSFSSGTSDVWIGMIIKATMQRKIVSLNGNGTHAKPKAASAPSVRGNSVAGTVMMTLLTQA